MSRTRRSFAPEFKVEAARRVIDGGRPVSEVARELNLHEACWASGCAKNESATGQPATPAMGRQREI